MRTHAIQYQISLWETTRKTYNLGLGGGDGEGRLGIPTAEGGGGGGLRGLSRQTPPKTRLHVEASPSEALLTRR